MGWQAVFRPQAWINNHATDVDPEGETHWNITDDDARLALPEATRIGADLDYLKDHANAPEWVRTWRGPFFIELIDPDGLCVDRTDVHPRER
ncbi:hypothetical protein [Mycolicibacterium mageritense]|uniref:hypothetical protein n=1 Tax=Mycolicibacterium mageritense TaxID=53462 RepID=UPI0011D416BE|nr:hypothetical protein [Mycolicibacterium mageritense]TXI53143.1 MAG: hypothetical protein E6Q55_35680 [Mycolicibacterium mageritense]